VQDIAEGDPRNLPVGQSESLCSAPGRRSCARKAGGGSSAARSREGDSSQLDGVLPPVWRALCAAHLRGAVVRELARRTCRAKRGASEIPCRSLASHGVVGVELSRKRMASPPDTVTGAADVATAQVVAVIGR